MILCFSGTGNSLAVAKALSLHLGDDVVRLDAATPPLIQLGDADTRIVWVVPVHSWGLPQFVTEFLRRAFLDEGRDADHFLVVTCGDDTGLVDRQWRRILSRKGWRTMSAHSVTMPNTYVLLPGFDVDSAEVAAAKIEAMPRRVAGIASAIGARSQEADMVRGSFPWLKSRVIYPLFMRFLTSPKPFHATSKCVGCGICATSCPLRNISMLSGRPVWGTHCTLCLGCYHKCPHHAVAYGRRTRGRGQSHSSSVTTGISN